MANLWSSSGISNGWSAQTESTLYKNATARKLGTQFMVNKESWEPQRVNNFELVVEGLNKIKMANGELFECADAGDRIMLSVQNFTAPSLEIAQITTQYANNSAKWAGKPEFPNSSITINDYIGIQVERVLSAWFRAAYDFESEKVGLAIDYKKTAHLIEYDPQGGSPRVWRMEGCWLASFQLGEWNQDGNQQRQLQSTLVYDRVYPVHFITSDTTITEGGKTSFTPIGGYTGFLTSNVVSSGGTSTEE